METPQDTTIRPIRIPVSPKVMALVKPFWEKMNEAKAIVQDREAAVRAILASNFDGFADGTFRFEDGYFIHNQKEETPDDTGPGNSIHDGEVQGDPGDAGGGTG